MGVMKFKLGRDLTKFFFFLLVDFLEKLGVQQRKHFNLLYR